VAKAAVDMRTLNSMLRHQLHGVFSGKWARLVRLPCTKVYY
jgi:hypothetical protein